jgi:hypothetical protein
MASCCAVIGSVTYALKGQRLLANYSIDAKVTKVRSSNTSGGCAYGIEFNCMNTDTVTSLLMRGGIQYRDIFRM